MKVKKEPYLLSVKMVKDMNDEFTIIESRIDDRKMQALKSAKKREEMLFLCDEENTMCWVVQMDPFLFCDHRQCLFISIIQNEL